jgi:hypothetical protein
MHVIRFTVAACCLSLAACANAIVRPAVSPAKPVSDALVVLPGFGYDRGGERAFNALAASMAAEGFDLYLPTYVSRAGLEESRERLQQFFRERHLSRYERVHVFAFIAGGWTFNPLGEAGSLPNLTTIVYDRSPYQERAPRVALEKIRLLTWVRYGDVVFDLARTSYVALTVPGVKVGLVVETSPTSFIKKHASTARSYGAYEFECGAFRQPYEDCLYVAMNHDELYARFGEVWPEVRSFIRTGRFSASANRTPPAPGPSAATGMRGVERGAR